MMPAVNAIARRTGRPAPTVFVEVSSEVPMAAGLGSSAAATVAGLRIFERVTGPADTKDAAPELLAITAFCHALLSANEFLYVD